MREEGAVQGELELQKEPELRCQGVQENRLDMGKALEGLVSETKGKSQSGGILKDQRGWEHRQRLIFFGKRSQESSCSSVAWAHEAVLTPSSDQGLPADQTRR